MRRRELLGLAAALAGARVLTRVLPSNAQTLAGKQIRLVVPFPAGGADRHRGAAVLRRCWAKR